MRQLTYATAYFRIGHIGFEKAWMDKIKELNDSMLVIDLSANLDLIKADYSHGDHSHTGIDPHVWMSPAMMESMARETYYKLKVLFPEHKEIFRKNYEALLGEIKLTGRFVDEQLSRHGGKAFLIFHPSLGYLAKEYYLQQISIEFEGKEPSPSHMSEIIKQAEERGIKSIFVQAEFDERNASIVAEEIGGSIIRINPLAENWAEEMKSIARKLEKALR